jgi:excisionase family DNA binding protein
MTATALISPRQAARAIGVSESSLKRWCDQGLIASSKTAGGHRKLPVAAVTEFLRAKSLAVVRPEVLGLPRLLADRPRAVELQCDAFYQALVAGDEETSRRILLDLHLSGERVSRIGDALVAPTLARIGSQWECQAIDAYQERLASRICLRLLDELRSHIPAAGERAPLAIGGTPDGDLYMLPTSLIEVTLQQAGWRAQSLGSRLPFESLSAAVRDLRPQLFWLSVSHIDDEATFLEGYHKFYEQHRHEVAIVVGGRALSESIRRKMQYAAFGDSLAHLESFAAVLKRTLKKRPAVQTTGAKRRTR